MLKLSMLFLVSFFMTGCVVKQEGIGFGSFTSKYKSIEFEKCQSKGCPEEVVIIGNVSAYRDIDEDINGEYSEYSKAALKFLIDKPVNLTEEEFTKLVAGWTMLQFFNIPLVGASYAGVLIDNTEQMEIKYPNSAEVILVQATGDLVAAKSNSDGVFFIDKQLCVKDDKYKECKESYMRGIFNAQSGGQLDRKFNEKENGKNINTETYEVLENH